MSNSKEQKQYRLKTSINKYYIDDIVTEKEISEFLNIPECIRCGWLEEVLPVSEPVKERIEVTHTVEAGKFRNTFYTSSAILKEKYKLVDAAIESVLNNDADTVVPDESQKQGRESWVAICDFLDGYGLKNYKWEYPIIPCNRVINFLKEKLSPEFDTVVEDNETKSANWRKENLSSLNQALTVDKVERDWEIKKLSTSGIGGTIEIFCYNEVYEKQIQSGRINIHSVKRLSDGVVFSVGGDSGSGVIKSFVIVTEENKDTDVSMSIGEKRGNIGKIAVMAGNNSLPNKLLEHLQPPPKSTEPKTVLFTTEDGVGIKHGQNYWHVVSDWTPQKETAQDFGKEEYQLSSLIRFSTKESAEQYILENKPCLSLNDLLEVGKTTPNITRTEHNEDYYKKSKLYKAFEKKAKEKLKQ